MNKKLLIFLFLAGMAIASFHFDYESPKKPSFKKKKSSSMSYKRGDISALRK